MDKKHLLVVDDNLELLMELQEALCMQGFAVTVLTNELETLDKVKALKPDLILLDIKLKEKTGMQLAVELHSIPETTAVPIILMTGYYTPTEMKRFMSLGIIKDWILKPIDMVSLLRKIESGTQPKSVGPQDQTVA